MKLREHISRTHLKEAADHPPHRPVVLPEHLKGVGGHRHGRHVDPREEVNGGKPPPVVAGQKHEPNGVPPEIPVRRLCAGVWVLKRFDNQMGVCAHTKIRCWQRRL